MKEGSNEKAREEGREGGMKKRRGKGTGGQENENIGAEARRLSRAH
jgi:hypothetical protein